MRAFLRRRQEVVWNSGSPPHTHTQTHSQKREARQMLTEEQQDTWMSLLVLEHSMTVEGVQTGHKVPGLGVPQTHTREQL